MCGNCRCISEKNLPPDGQNTIPAARNWYLFELSDDDRKAIQQESVNILENIPQAGIGRRRIWEPETLPKDIRLINSHYDDLYRIPDGGVVQVDYPDGRSFTARLEHLDDYHFDMGGLGNVFHICQFAEVMERNHADFYPEIQTQDEQAAWELGGKGYLAIQSCEDGWDYTLYHSDYSVMDGGQLAIGGGSAMDAAKIMWVMYEHPEADFLDMAMRFMDIRKRIYTFPKMGEKAYFVAISTSSGTGSEVTPFAVITDETTGQKYPLADYELLPKMAIIDADMHMNQPKGLTAASGIDALTHALEAYASIMATEYTDGLALQAMKNIFEYLPAAYELGAHDAVAREKMATASTMAGMAFANAFLGVCHSLAHKLGAYHHLPHGIANALLITDVMRFNAAEVPTKMGTFSQYQYPHCKARYVECADFLGIQGKDDDEKFENLIKAIEELKAKVGIKKTIADYGVKEEDFLATLDEMTEAAFDDQCTGANPRYPLMSEMKAMYLKAYYGK